MPQDIGYAQALAEELNRQLYERANWAIREMGTPPGQSKLTEKDEVRFWWLADRSVDVQDLVVNQGMSPEEATLVKYPFRRKLLLKGKPMLKQRVEYAQRMKRLRDKYIKGAIPEPPTTDELDAAEAEIGTMGDERLLGPLGFESAARYGGTPFAPSRPTQASAAQLATDANPLELPAAVMAEEGGR